MSYLVPNSRAGIRPAITASYVRAFSTLGCPELTLEGVFALARAHGVGAVELRALEGSLDLPSYFSGLATAPAALIASATGHGIGIAALATSFRIIDGTEEERAKFLEFVPWAEALGIPRLRVFDGGKTAAGAELERASATLGWWARLRAERGWKTDLMVETHDALVDSAAINRFVQAVPDTAILWDSHHTWRKGGEDPAATWRAIRSHVVHIHVKDSTRTDDPNQPYNYTLPGTGEFPMATLRQALGEEFTGPVSLEWEKQWHPELPSLAAALDSAAAASWW